MRESSVDAISPAIKDIAKPWNIGSNSITKEPTTTAAAVKSIGRKRMEPASTTASFKGRPSATFKLMKSTSIIEFLTIIPAPAMNPIIEVAVKNAPKR